MQLLGQSHQRHRVVLRGPLRVPGLGSVEDAPREGQRGPSEVGGWLRNKLPVEQGDLRNVQSHVLYLGIIRGIQDGDLQEAIHGGVSDGPPQGLQDVPFHLDEHVVIVERATHGLQFLDCGHTVLLVPILGCDQECRTAYQLVMSLVHDPLGAIPVEQIDRQEQGRRQQLERGVGFDEEVKEVGTHEPLNLGLDIDRLDIGEGRRLNTHN